MKFTIKILILLCAGCVGHSLIQAVDFLTQSPPGTGSYLAHVNYGVFQFANQAGGSIFLTADQGAGFQAELTPNATIYSNVGKKNPGIIECQQPFGNPTACATSCTGGPVGGPYGPKQICTGVVRGQYYGQAPSGSTVTDFLNENNSKPTSFVSIDTIVNNSNSSFEIAVTTAPLYGIVYDTTNKKYIADANTIAGAINAGKLNIFNDIYSQKPAGNITIGSKSYPITFISENSTVKDNRYLIAQASKHNPPADTLAIKKHMADTPIGLDVSPTGPGNQTLILFPNRMQTTCQPVIFIGRDKDNVFYALTYLGAYTSTGGEVCCQNNDGTQCNVDTVYPSGDPANLQLPAAIANTDQSDPNYIKPGQPGRLSLDIACSKNLGGDGTLGYAASLKSLPGPWYPGRPDFANIPAKPIVCTPAS